MKRLLAIILLLASLAILVPAASAADTYADREKAVVELALAYHYNPNMQYDSTQLTLISKNSQGVYREHDMVAPEEGTPDSPVYTVCSSFCWEIYYNAFGYKLTEHHYPDFATYYIFKNFKDSDITVFYTLNSEQKDPVARMEEAKKLLKPGDIIVTVSSASSGGHAMLYVGDVDGDGRPDIIHSSGKKYDMETGTDQLETTGNIKLQPCDDLVFTEGKSYYLPKKYGYIILRPLLGECGRLPITEATKSRVQYSCMNIDRTVNVSPYGSIGTGEELTYRLDICNHSSKAYTGLPVTEKLPAGTELVESSLQDGTRSGDTLSWKVDVPAGGSKTITYKVKVTAKRGETIVSTGGFVDKIPSNTLTTPVRGKSLDAEKFKSGDYKAMVQAADGDPIKFANTLYRSILGIDLQLPSGMALGKALFTRENINAHSVCKLNPLTADSSPFRQMLAPGLFGGQYAYTQTSRERVLDPRPSYLEPGDLLVVSKAGYSIERLYVCSGTSLLTMNSAKTGLEATNGKAAMTALLSKDLFYVLRPTLAYDDINAECKYVPAVKLPFTDVKEGDWYYEFVKELYEKKIVAGMTDTTFVPNGKLTYGQALKLIVVGLGNPEQASTGGNWASGYLKFAKDKKWLDKDVDLNGSISRLQFCQIAAKAKNLTAQPASNPFKDCADKDVLALVNANIINGMSADTFAPNSTLTRAQISKIISGLIQK